MISPAVERAEHRSGAGAKRRTCLSEASCAPSPWHARSAGDRCGAAASARGPARVDQPFGC
ncbi:MAG TPA: hypothetical protein DD456_10310 [Stenotrophomonas sp.]|nr:hypothetical protein [Stenotrophomonas sp.]